MSKDKKVTYTPKQLKELEQNAVGKALTLMVACLMDEYDLEAYDIDKLMDRLIRYSNAWDEGLLTNKVVANIIKEKTGVEIKWR